ncbi:MAG: hypothetical protein ABIF19_15635, partial [Planctomycetota bacterium]
MNKHTIIIAVLMLCILLPARSQSESKADLSSDQNNGRLTIIVLDIELNEKCLNLRYEIRNDSEDDAWILVGGYKFSDSTFGMGAGVLIAEDGNTLTISARFKRPTTGMGFQPVYGRFVRLRPGDSQTESIFMRIPAYLGSQFGHVERQEQVIKHATRLAIELGYYRGNLPERILSSLKPLENIFPK